MDKSHERKAFSPLRLFLENNIARLGMLLLLFLIVASIVRTQNFLKLDNFRGIMIQMVEYGLMALGCSVAMISGGIDLSTVYIANLTSIIAAKTMHLSLGMGSGLSILVGIIVALVVGALCGVFNGFLISKLRIPPMLATLGTYQLFMGIAILISSGTAVPGGNPAFSGLTSKSLFGLFPISFIIFVLAVAIIAWIMQYTRFGVHVYLVGTNAKAASFTGVHNSSVIMRTYMVSGIVSAVAGIISLSRLNTAKADFGSSYTMLTILIAVLGGIDPNGGSGSIVGVGIAVATLQVISSFLNMFPTISNYYRDLIWGVALIGVLILNHELAKRKVRRQMQIKSEDMPDIKEEETPEA